jgi:hypothetical protein
MGDRKGEYRVLTGGNQTERDNLENLHIDGGVILKLVFKKWNRETWTGFILPGGRHL